MISGDSVNVQTSCSLCNLHVSIVCFLLAGSDPLEMPSELKKNNEM